MCQSNYKHLVPSPNNNNNKYNDSNNNNNNDDDDNKYTTTTTTPSTTTASAADTSSNKKDLFLKLKKHLKFILSVAPKELDQSLIAPSTLSSAEIWGFFNTLSSVDIW